MSKDFNSFVSTLKKECDSDSFTKIYDPGVDLFQGSHIPYGVKSGIPELDLSFCRPGWPAGRIVELYGFEGSGKTTLGLHAIANCQKMGGFGFFIDTEKTFDPIRATEVGVNVKENFTVVECGSTEAAFRTLQSISNTACTMNPRPPMVAVVDSITGAQDEFHIEKTLGEEQRTGHEAKVIRQGIRSVAGKISESKLIVILVNHAIAKIVSFGKQSQAAGGHAPKFYSSCRVCLVKTGEIREGTAKERKGQKVKLEVEKSKVGHLTNEKIDVELLNESGFDTMSNLFNACVKVGLIERKTPKTYEYNLDGEIVSLAKSEWPKLVTRVGGIDVMYDIFYDYCFKTGKMRPYV